VVTTRLLVSQGLVSLAAVLTLAAVLAGCKAPQVTEGYPLYLTPRPTSVQTPARTLVPSPTPGFGSDLGARPVSPTPGAARATEAGSTPESMRAVPTATPSLGPLFSPGLDLRAGPLDVGLEVQIPSLQVKAAVLGVGMTSKNVMDAPLGPVGDAVWHKLFWYRGSGVPGDSGTATIAGHVNGRGGIPAVFANLQNLRKGALIVVHDLRSGQDVRFTVTEIRTYTEEQATDPAVLARIYGAGPVSGQGPQPALDGHSHLALVTCAGDYVNGSFDHRLVVYADRSG